MGVLLKNIIEKDLQIVVCTIFKFLVRCGLFAIFLFCVFFVCLFFTVSILYVCSIAELHAPVPPAPQHPALSHRHIPAAQHWVRQQFTLKAAPMHQNRLRGSVGAPAKFVFFFKKLLIF